MDQLKETMSYSFALVAEKAKTVTENAKTVVGGMTGESMSASVALVSEKARSAAGSAKAAVGGAVGKAREMVGLTVDEEAAQEESSMMDELSQTCSLTYKQRLYGFATCMALGLFFMLLSMLVFFHPVKFAITYSLGNMMALGSTGFLIGFWRQLQLMCAPIRAISAWIYIVSIFLTLFCSLWLRDSFLTMICIVLQESSLVWYGLSYIPFAQALVKRMFRSCFDVDF